MMIINLEFFMRNSWQRRVVITVFIAAFGSAMAPLSEAIGQESSLSKFELREMASSLFGQIPDKMPGSEKDTAAQIQLGEKLFFDTLLSENRSQSCNSCHRVDENLGGVDNEPTSPGAFGERGGRNAPTVLNAGFHIAQFWDGRAADLVAQAKGPILNPIEMAMPNPELVLERLSKSEDYPGLFKTAFPDSGKVSYDHVAKAIAAFERTLITEDRFDDFLAGDDSALKKRELRGLETFMTVGCTACHNGPLLGGNTYQKIGLVHPYVNTNDKGLSEVTKNEDDQFKFKVPSLRNIALTGPYLHDGHVWTLNEVVRQMAWMQLGRKLTDREAGDIVAFFRSLSDKKRAAASRN